MPVEGKAMKRGSLLGWVGIAVLAAATAWVVFTSGGSPATPAPTATVTPHIIIVPVTMTASPTATAPAPVVVPPTRTPRLPPNEVVTDAPTRAPSATATQWSAPTVPWTGEALTLHAPDAETLFKVVQFAARQGQDYFDYLDSDEVRSTVANSERYGLDEFVEADVVRHYTGGLTTDSTVLTSAIEYWSPWPPNSLLRLLRAATIRHVLEHKTEVLQNGLVSGLGHVRLVTSELEMDGDPGREWLVAVTFKDYEVKDWLPFDEDADGRVRYLEAPWLPFFFGYDPVDFDGAHDFTGDGRAEIVIVQHFYLAGHFWGNGSVYHWRGDGWQLVGTPALPSGPVGWDISSEYALDDFTGDGRADFRVTTPNYYGFGCRTDTVIDYVWDGVNLVATGAEPPLPATGNCLIYAAEHAGSLAGEARGFERVLTLLEVEDAKPDLLAWVRVQLAMRYAALGSGAEAEALLTAAAQAEGQGGYVDLLRQATAEVGSKPVAVCAWLYERADEEEVFGRLNTDIDDDLQIGGYPRFYELNPARVCPFPLLVSQVLVRLTLPAVESPAVALEAQGLSLALFEPLALDNDAETEYVGVLAGPWGRIVIFDQQGGRWQAVEANANASATMALAVVDGAQPGNKDILLDWAIVAPNSGWQCAAGEAPLELMRLVRGQSGWAAAGWISRCADPALLDLTDPANQAAVMAMLDEDTSAPVVDTPTWMQLDGYPGWEPASYALLRYVSELQTNVLERRYPLATQTAITALLTYLPHDDANAQLVVVRLLYLRGLGYELAGDDAAAVAAYTEVLRAAPGSAWAWLAWARVGPIAPGG